MKPPGVINVAATALLISYMTAVATAFTAAPYYRIPLQLTATSRAATRVVTEQQQQQLLESDRLVKARRLLEQISSNDAVMEDEVASTPVTSSRTTTTQVLDENNNLIVPDTYWRNGHLQEGSSSFVTRWAGGVKVAEPLVKYDPIVAERLLFRQPTKWLLRNFQIAWPLGWWAVAVATDYALGRDRELRRERANQLTRAISSLGPAIIKGGQALASRPDLLPSEYLEELQKLQDDVPRFSNKVALATVEEELGVKFDEIFELVQEEPIAAASIGQVYKARLRDTGELVALKIQRPGCEEIIALDLYVLRWWSGVYSRVFRILNRDIDLQAVIDDFGELIYREIGM